MGRFGPFRAMATAGFFGVVALLALPSAWAEEAEGIVDSVDLDRRLLTLVDGEIFILAEAVDAEVIQQGEAVFIVFDLDDREQKVAREVLLAVQE